MNLRSLINSAIFLFFISFAASCYADYIGSWHVFTTEELDRTVKRACIERSKFYFCAYYKNSRDKGLYFKPRKISDSPNYHLEHITAKMIDNRNAKIFVMVSDNTIWLPFTLFTTLADYEKHYSILGSSATISIQYLTRKNTVKVFKNIPVDRADRVLEWFMKKR